MKPTTPTFTLRLPAELRQKLQARADAENRSLANYVTTILIRAAAARGATMPAMEQLEQDASSIRRKLGKE